MSSRMTVLGLAAGFCAIAVGWYTFVMPADEQYQRMLAEMKLDIQEIMIEPGFCRDQPTFRADGNIDIADCGAIIEVDYYTHGANDAAVAGTYYLLVSSVRDGWPETLLATNGEVRRGGIVPGSCWDYSRSDWDCEFIARTDPRWPALLESEFGGEAALAL